MAEPNSDAKDTNVVDDPKEVSGTPPTLDQVHQMSQAKVEEEDLNGSGTGDGEEEVEEPAADDKPVVDEPGGSGDADAVDEPDEPEDEDEPVVTPPADDTPKPTEPAAELDTDTSKPGDGKIAIKDAEGKTHYFNNRDEVPDDFEPASYKELMNASTAFARKEDKDERLAADADVKAKADLEAAETKQRVDAMQEGWEKDAKALVDAGVFPKDAKKLEAAKEEVYTYIDSEMKKGNVITSFNQAYKAMAYDKQQAKAAEDQKQSDKDKKTRGGIVQPGSGGTPATRSTGRGRVIEAPPQGVGLDAVHARAQEQLAA